MESKLQHLAKVLKLKTSKDLVNVRKPRKNLYETLALYPNKGINFKVWQKDWQPDHFYVIKHYQELGNEKKALWGTKFVDGLRTEQTLEVIANAHQKDLWNHYPGDDNIVLENGVKIGQREILLFYRKNFPKLKVDN